MPYLGKTPSQATRQRYYKTASGGETSISGTMTTGGTLTFNDGEFVDVSVNGVALVAGTDYNTNTANTIAGLSALSANDQVEIVVYDTFSVFSGDVDSNLSVGGNLSVTGTTALTGAATLTAGFTASDGCTITTADNDPQLTLVSTDADASRGPELLLYRNSASPANSDALGFIRWDGENDSGAQHEYIKLEGIISASSGAATGAEQAQLDIRTMVSGTDRSRINILHDSTVFNDDSQDLDFRIDSSGYGTHNFFLQASNGYIAIQSDTPEHPFDVQGNASGPYLMRIFNDGNAANRKGLKIQCGQDSGDQVFIAFEDGDGNSVGSIQGSSGTAAYNTFTAGHPATLPSSDADEGYPYGTLVETTGITYSTDSGGNTTRGGIIYSVQKSSSANSKSVLGAYASKDNVNDGQHIVYVLGDGHILCNNAGGNIAVGDGICTSATAGIGQKATASPSMIIGIAQEAVTFANDSETKLVPVQYGLQQFTPWS